MENQYINLIKNIMKNGVERMDRTGTGTLSIFAPDPLRFCLRNSFPLLTTKRVFFKGVAEELLWFLKGDTDAKHLSEKGVRIWEANGTREFLDSRGLDYREGDLGPVYGFQWRHFGAEYKNCETNYENMGFDQIKEIIHLINTDPLSRRIILSAWNPKFHDQMALPPCHVLAQFYVNNGELSCQMYQRSADIGLGVPFNIASYSLLTVMLAHVTGLKPGDFIHVMGDAHIYKDHLSALKQQILNEPRPMPQLRIKNKVDSIFDFQIDDFEVLNYDPHKKIEMKMSV